MRDYIERYWWVFLILALVAGGVFAWLNHGQPPPVNLPLTDQAIQAVTVQVDHIARTVETLTRQGRKEVTVIREKTRRDVRALPPDDVCAALNDELSRYRDMAARARGMDCSD